MNEKTPYVVCYSITDDMWVVYYRRFRDGVQPLERLATGETKASAWANAQDATHK